MTREQLDAIRARVAFHYGPHTDVLEIKNSVKDILSLLSEIERLKAAEIVRALPDPEDK